MRSIDLDRKEAGIQPSSPKEDGKHGGGAAASSPSRSKASEQEFPLHFEHCDNSSHASTHAYASTSPVVRHGSVRSALIWAAFASSFVVEAAVHIALGVGASVFEAEEQCKLLRSTIEPYRCSVFLFCEIICRSCLTIMVTSMLWNVIVVTRCSDVSGSLCRVFEGDGTLLRISSRLFAAVVSTFILCLGVWCALDEDSLAPWAVGLCHVCDMFCHGAVLSALVGIVYDVYMVGRSHHRIVLWNLLCCRDTVEAHGVGNDPVQVQYIPMDFMEFSRAAFIWVLNLLTLAAAIADVCFPDRTAEWVSTATKLEGCICWSGIAWWLTQSMVDGLSERLNRSQKTSPEIGRPSGSSSAARSTSILELASGRMHLTRSVEGESA